MAGTLIKKRQIENLGIVNADVASGAAIATSKLAEGADFIQRDGTVAYTADQSMGNNKLTNLAAPVSPNDAVRLVDLQNNQAGLVGKDAARAATTGNITLSAAQTIDGISVVAGDRVLVKNQTLPANNGIYIVATGAWTRATDADTAAELKSGSYVFVSEGTINADSGWLLSTDGTITLGTTALNFVQFTGAGQIDAGAGITKTGNQINIGTASSARIVVNADNIDLATVGTAGTNTKVTWDAYGRITGSTSATPADIGAQVANANLTSLAAIASTGFYVSTGTNTNTVRSIAGTAGEIAVTNGDGVSGNPTLSLIATGVSGGTYNTVKGVSELRLLPELLINKQTWTTNQGNLVQLDSSGIRSANLELMKGGNGLKINGTGANGGFPINLQFMNFSIATLASMIQSDTLVAEGLINGTVELKQSAPLSFVADLSIDSIKAFSQPIGTLKLDASNSSEEVFNVAAALKGDSVNLTVKGDYTTTGDNNLNFVVDIPEFSLTAAQPFVRDMVSK
ncbi:MAG: hypothetical protein EOP51_29110, partial [Sphingobacteriales bacterium]